MSVLCVGISHKSAPLALLERVTVGLAAGNAVLGDLGQAGPLLETVVLSTCNRVEVYADSDGFHPGVAAISELLSGRSGVPLEELSPHLYVHWDAQAVAHLFQVACGLDSLVVGESQILGQLRRAFEEASDARVSGRVLHDLFTHGLRVGKRVHTDTGIDAAGQSVVSVGLDVAAEVLGPLAGRQALVVGAGSMGALAGATLRRLGVERLVVANRSEQTATRLAASLEGRSVGLGELEDEIAAADLVVTTTGAIGLVVERDLVERAVKLRSGRPLVLVDLALPHDVDPAVRELDGVTLVDLDSLTGSLRTASVAADVETARGMVAEEVGAFLATRRAALAAPTVVALRGRAADLVDAELERLAARLPDLDARTQSEVAMTVRRVVDKLLHAPTVRVKELAETPAGASYADALRVLFQLDPAAPEAVAGAVTTREEGP